MGGVGATSAAKAGADSPRPRAAPRRSFNISNDPRSIDFESGPKLMSGAVREGDMQTGAVALEGERPLGTGQFDPLDLMVRQGTDGDLAGGTSQRHRVKRALIDREADVLGGEGAHLLLAELARTHLGRAFARHAPGAAAEDGFAIAAGPAADLFDDLALLGIDGAIAADRDTEQQIAVFRDHVAQPVDDRLSPDIGLLLETLAIIVPIADAGIGLPGQGLDVGTKTPFDILDQRAFALRRQELAIEDDIQRAMPFQR